MPPQKIFLHLLVAVLFFSVAAQSAAVIDRITPDQGGIAGGTRLSILGSGFDIRGRSNDVYIGTTELGSFCDPIPNECHETRIVCLTAPFPGRGPQPLMVKSLGFIADCNVKGGCIFTYTFERTPEMYDITPEWLTAPAEVTVSGRRFSTGDATIGKFDFTMHIGEEERCGLDDRMVSWSSFVCDVESMFPGPQDVYIQHGASGDATYREHFQLNVYPFIENVFPKFSSVAGGQTLTIFGTSFSRELTENMVKVHGAPCPVTAYIEDAIECVTTPHMPTSDVTPPWEEGKVLVEWWYGEIGRNGVQPEQWTKRETYPNPTGSLLTGEFGGPIPFNLENYAAARYTTYFIPNVTGNHTFLVGGDDATELWLSEDDREVPRIKTRVVIEDPLYERRIAFTNGYTGGSFEEVETQRSKPMHLEAGKRYWMQGLLGNGGSSMYLNVGILLPNSQVPLLNPSGSFVSYRPRYHPPVEVITRGARAMYGTHCLNHGNTNCTVHYAMDKTPSITSVTPSNVTVGSTIVVAGTGFSEGGVEVLIGGFPCDITGVNAAANSVSCSVSMDLPPGTHPVSARVTGWGMATSSFFVSTYPTLSSMTGAKPAMLSGTGFGKHSSFAVDNNVDPCAVEKVSPQEIRCTFANGLTTGSHLIRLAYNTSERGVLPLGFTYRQPYVRPGTTKKPSPPWINPQRGMTTGNQKLLVAIPGKIFNMKEGLNVTMGENGMHCKVIYSFSSRIVCLTPYTLRSQNVNVYVHYKGEVFTAGIFSFVDAVSNVYPIELGPHGGNTIRIQVESSTAKLDQVTVAFEGQLCAKKVVEGTTLYCTISHPRPTALPALPVLASYSPSTSNNNIMKSLWASRGVQQTSTSFIIPADGYLVSKRHFTRPIVFRAKIRPTTEYVDDKTSCVRMGALIEDRTAIHSGYHAYAGYRSNRFGIASQTHYPTSVEQYTEHLINTGLDPSRFAEWKIEVHPYTVEFFVDNVLVQRYSNRDVTVGSVGFVGGCQQIEVKDIVVEDLYPRVLQVNASGKPLYNTFSPFYGNYQAENEVAVTSVYPTSVKGGDKITIAGTNFRDEDDWRRSYYGLYVHASGVSAEDALSLCTGNMDSTETTLICEVSREVPFGSYVLRVGSYEGFFEKSLSITVTPVMDSVSPNEISPAGGIMTIVGGGFKQDTATINIGTVSCPVIRSSVIQLQCRVPPKTADGSMGPFNVFAKIGISTLNCPECVIKYLDSANAPTVTSIYPSTLTYDGQWFDIRGTNFDSWSVVEFLANGQLLANANCYVTSASSTHIYCHPTGLPFTSGTINAVVTTSQRGTAIGMVSFTMAKGIGITDTFGSLNGGNPFTFRGYFDVPSPTATLAHTKYDDLSATPFPTDAWEGAPEAYMTSCHAPFARMLGGQDQFGRGTSVYKTFTAIPSHANLHVTARIAILDGWWDDENFLVYVDGSKYSFVNADFDCRRDATTSVCGDYRRDYRDCMLKLDFIVPHTSPTVTVTFTSTAAYDRRHRSWGILEYRIGHSTTTGYFLKLGTSGCNPTYISTNKLVCTAPALSTGGMVAATGTYNSVALGTNCFDNKTCPYTYTATSTPLPKALTLYAISTLNSCSIHWENLKNVKVIHGSPARAEQNVSLSGWSSGAVSVERFYADDNFGGVDFKFFGEGRAMFGLSANEVNSERYTDLRYSWYRTNENDVVVYEGGEYIIRAPRKWRPHMKMSILVNATLNTVMYLQDDIHVFTSREPLQWPLRVDMSIYDKGMGVEDVVLRCDASPQKTPLLIVGTGIVHDSHTSILVDGTACKEIETGPGYAVCNAGTLPNLISQSTHMVRVDNSQGTGTTASLTLNPAIVGIQPMFGSPAGGQILTILGGGFTTAPIVTIGANPCDVTDYNFGLIKCKTRATTEKSPIVSVTVGSVPAMSFNVTSAYTVDIGEIHFQFSAAFACPFVIPNPVTQPGSTLSVTFASAECLKYHPYLFIHNNGGECKPTAPLSTTFTCVVSQDTVPGTYNAYAITDHGLTASQPLTVNYPAITVSPATIASANSHVKLTITSANGGFGCASAPLPTVASSSVNLCQELIRTSNSQLICYTKGGVGVTGGLTVKSNGIVSSSVPLTSVAGASTITSIAPAKVAQGDIITLTGTNLGDLYNASVGAVFPVSSTTAYVLINRPLKPSETLNVDSVAYGRSASQTLTSEFRVVKVSPPAAPPGSTVTIHCSGLPASSDIHVRVGGYSCNVLSVMDQDISCKLANFSETIGQPSHVEVMLTPTIGALYYTYSYTDSAPTPTVTSISPTTGGKGGNELVTITGTGFHNNVQQNYVKVGGLPCEVNNVSTDASTLTCTTAPKHNHSNTDTSVSVTVNGKTGTGSGVVFTYTLTVSSVSPTTIGTEGGQRITVLGTGFPTEISSRLKVDISGVTCRVVELTSSSLVCIAPALNRTREENPSLLQGYPPRSPHPVSLSLSSFGVPALESPTFTVVDAPTILSLSPSPGTQTKTGDILTIGGTNFGTAPTVHLRNIRHPELNNTCTIASANSGQILCSLDHLESFGNHFVEVMTGERGLGYASRSCLPGEYMMCDGQCLTNADCVYEEWGVYTCTDLAQLIAHDTFCHSNGGTDRVNQPLVLDNGKEFNMNCPMYSCEGGDCETEIHIGGKGAVISTCGKDPIGFSLDVRPVITSVSGSKTSGLLGGNRITILGTGLGMEAAVHIGSSICVPVAATTTSLECETTPAAESTALKLTLSRNGAVAICGTACDGFAYSAASTPSVTDIAPREGTSSCATGVYGQPITITGTAFSAQSASMFFIFIGGQRCNVTTFTTTEIVCSAPGLVYGRYDYSVRIEGQGLATMHTTYTKICFDPWVFSSSHPTTSITGGARMTIYGSGFDPRKDMTVVYAESCMHGTNYTVNETQIALTTLANCPSARSFIVSVRGKRAYCFTSGCMPRLELVNSITSTNTNGAITITSASSSTTFDTTRQGDYSIMVGSVAGSIDSFSTSTLLGTAPVMPVGGVFVVQLHDKSSGFAKDTTTTTHTSSWDISTVFPATGSLGGGSLLTITGTNLGTETTNHNVTIDGVPCVVEAAASTSLNCRTAPNMRSDVAHNIRVEVIGYNAPTGEWNTKTTTGTITFSSTSTPRVNSITPHRGSTAGGTVITLLGTGFTSTNNNAALSFTIGGVLCGEISKTDTQYVCVTGPHKTDLIPEMIFGSQSYGRALFDAGVQYEYIDLWSRWTTWGNKAPPIEGDSAVISEGQVVMLDISPPRIFLVIVMGHFLFDQTVDLTFEATYIMINFGRMTIGTNEAPYTKKATIRLYGNRLTPEIPVHGSKVLALRHGALDMHGIKRTPTWTRLAQTATAGSRYISVTGPVDWKVGEQIVIASTDFKMEHAEERVIASIINENTNFVTIGFINPLYHTHNGQEECFDSGKICIKEIAEVIHLTRNIVIEGDRDSQRLGFGGTLFLMPLGATMEKYARLSYVEFRDVGQQYIVGRYPVHYHVTHNINTSFVNGTAVHRSLNRAFSIHGLFNNTYVNNVVFDTHGHAFFIEDGSEKWNVIRNNAVITARTSTSNLNTDITPADFWCVSPSNYIEGNAACGSAAYGFWIAPFHPHSTGPTYSPDVCPSTHKMWRFANNVAHSAKKYGLNIFPYWWPKKKECDFNGEDEPAVVENHFSYKNKIHGVTVAHSEIGRVGAVTFDGLISANNGEEHKDSAAFWVERIEAANMTFGVRNSVLIAQTSNQPHSRRLARRGINLPLGDNFFSDNVTFVNYKNENFGFEPQAWAFRFSFCFPWGWEAMSKGLKWVNSDNRVLFRFVHHGVLNDIDGTLTGVAESQLVPKAPIYDPNFCPDWSLSSGRHPAQTCSANYKVRRFGLAHVSHGFKDQIWTIDGREELVPEITRKYAICAPINRNVSIDFQVLPTPDEWDWNLNARFCRKDEKMIFHVHYPEPRDSINATFDGKEVPMMDRPPTLSDTTSGFYRENKSFDALLALPDTRLKVKAAACPPEGCPYAPVEPPPVIKECSSFDDPESWTTKTVPTKDVKLNHTDSICLDRLSGNYTFGSLIIAGSLILENKHCPPGVPEVVIMVERFVHIRGGRLLLGNATEPLTACKIRFIIGPVDVANVKRHQVLPWSPRSIILEAGHLGIYGSVPPRTRTRLLTDAAAGSITVTLVDVVAWKVGDVIGIAGTTRPTMYKKAIDRTEESEEAVIASIAANVLTLTTALKHTHKAGDSQTIDGKIFYPSAEVVLLSRMITITGNHGNTPPAFDLGWALNVGCTADVTTGCGTGTTEEGFPMSRLKTARLEISGAQMDGIGQGSSFHGGVEIDGLISPQNELNAGGSYIAHSVFYRTLNTALAIRHTTTNFTVRSNTFFRVAGDGVRVISGNNFIDNNIVIAITIPPQCNDIYRVQSQTCITSGYRIARSNTVRSNVISSSPGVGFSVEGEECSARTTEWNGNVARFVRDGVLILGLPADLNYLWPLKAQDCRYVSGITAQDCADHGMAGFLLLGNLIVENYNSISNEIGFTSHMAYAGPDDKKEEIGNHITVRNSLFVGHWNGQPCVSEKPYVCRKTILNNFPFCQMLYGTNGPLMSNVGIMESIFVNNLYSSFPPGEHKTPWTEVDNYATVKAKVNFENIFFDNFMGNTSCGTVNVAFAQNPYSNDTFHQHSFKGIRWGANAKTEATTYAYRMYGEAKGHFSEFKQTVWLDFDNHKFGAYWPDSPLKFWIVDEDGTFTRAGAKSHIIASETITRTTPFSKIGWDGAAFKDLPALSPAISGCAFKEAWKAYTCDDTRKFVSVVVESLATDALTRRAAPVVMCPGNGMIDEKGHPLCQEGAIDISSGPVMKGKVQRATLERLPRFRFIVENGGNYTLYFRGVPPTWLRFWLTNYEHLLPGTDPIGITANLRYHGENAQSRVGVYHVSKRLRPVFGDGYPWQMNPAKTWPGPGDAPGTHFHNRGIFGNVSINTMYFSLRPNGTTDLKQEPIVIVKMTVSMPLEEFFNNKDTFAASLASLLGIDASRMRFVDIRPGTTRRRLLAASTDVKVEIDQDENTLNAAQQEGTIAADDFSAILAKVASLETNPTAIDGFTVSNVVGYRVSVTNPEPDVTVTEGYDYILLNVTRQSQQDVNVSEVAESVAAHIAAKHPTISPQNTTTSGEVAVGNLYKYSNNYTRFTLFTVYDTQELSNTGTASLAASFEGNLRVLPTDYIIHTTNFHAGTPPPIVVIVPTPSPVTTTQDPAVPTTTSSATPSPSPSPIMNTTTPAPPAQNFSMGDTNKFAIAVAVCVLALFLIGGAILTYFICCRKKPKQPTKTEEKETEEEDGEQEMDDRDNEYNEEDENNHPYDSEQA